MSRQASLEVTSDRLLVRGSLDFDTVSGIEAEGTAWLTGLAPSRAVVDLSGVEYGNSAGVALLLSWLRAARSGGRQLVFEAMPEEMRSMVKVGGLASLLVGNEE